MKILNNITGVSEAKSKETLDFKVLLTTRMVGQGSRDDSYEMSCLTLQEFVTKAKSKIDCLNHEVLPIFFKSRVGNFIHSQNTETRCLLWTQYILHSAVN